MWVVERIHRNRWRGFTESHPDTNDRAQEADVVDGPAQPVLAVGRLAEVDRLGTQRDPDRATVACRGDRLAGPDLLAIDGQSPGARVDHLRVEQVERAHERRHE